MGGSPGAAGCAGPTQISLISVTMMAALKAFHLLIKELASDGEPVPLSIFNQAVIRKIDLIFSVSAGREISRREMWGVKKKREAAPRRTYLVLLVWSLAFFLSQLGESKPPSSPPIITVEPQHLPPPPPGVSAPSQHFRTRCSLKTSGTEAASRPPQLSTRSLSGGLMASALRACLSFF